MTIPRTKQNCVSKFKLYIHSSNYFTYFWNSHSLLSNGHTCLVLSQREMQWKWKACYKNIHTNK